MTDCNLEITREVLHREAAHYVRPFQRFGPDYLNELLDEDILIYGSRQLHEAIRAHFQYLARMFPDTNGATWGCDCSVCWCRRNSGSPNVPYHDGIQPCHIVQLVSDPPDALALRRYQSEFWDVLIDTCGQTGLRRAWYAVKTFPFIGQKFDSLRTEIYFGLWGACNGMTITCRMADALDAAQLAVWKVFPQVKHHPRMDEVIVEMAGEMLEITIPADGCQNQVGDPVLEAAGQIVEIMDMDLR